MNVLARHILFLSVLFFLILPTPTYAYLDPGTGSYLLQIMAAVFFGGAYALTTWWKQIKLFVGRIFFRKDKKTSEKPSGKEK